jgi:hypothetical protein
MSKCGLCFLVTGNQADYALTFGNDGRILKTCRYCYEDLTLLGFRANRVVRLKATEPFRRCPSFRHLVVLGPVYTLLVEAGL